MTNKPLKSIDLIKIIFLVIAHVIMLLLSLAQPIYIVITGIPAIILLTGYFLMRRELDADIFSKTLKVCKLYTYVAGVLLYLIMLYIIFIHMGYSGSESIEYLLYSLLVPLAVFTYSILLNILLKKPFEDHREWIAEKGIFTYIKNK